MTSHQIKAALIRKGIMLKDIARRLDVHPSLITQIIRRRYRSKNAQQYIADILGLPHDQVFGDSPTPPGRKHTGPMTPNEIRAELAERDIPVKELAYRLNVSGSNVSAVIYGREKNPRIRNGIAQIIGRPVNELFPDAA